MSGHDTAEDVAEAAFAEIERRTEDDVTKRRKALGIVADEAAAWGERMDSGAAETYARGTA